MEEIKRILIGGFIITYILITLQSLAIQKDIYITSQEVINESCNDNRSVNN